MLYAISEDHCNRNVFERFILIGERENKFRLIPYLKYILCFANTQSNIYPGMNFYPDMSINVEKKHSLVFIDLYIVQ